MKDCYFNFEFLPFRTLFSALSALKPLLLIQKLVLPVLLCQLRFVLGRRILAPKILVNTVGDQLFREDTCEYSFLSFLRKYLSQFQAPSLKISRSVIPSIVENITP